MEVSFTPFEGELRDQNGVLRCEADRRLTPAEILCMDYLVDNIVGSFPKEEELIEFQLNRRKERKPEQMSMSR